MPLSDRILFKESDSIENFGVNLLFSNDKCFIYYIKNLKGARLCGTRTEWCIATENEKQWKEHNRDFIFLCLLSRLSKTHKYAIVINRHSFFDYNTIIWQIFDEQDTQVLGDIFFQFDLNAFKVRNMLYEIDKSRFKK